MSGEREATKKAQSSLPEDDRGAGGTEAVDSAIKSHAWCQQSPCKQEERGEDRVESAINAGDCWGLG